MVAIPVLPTERLVLRPFSLADAPRVEALLATPEIADTTTVSYPYPEGAGAAWIATHPVAATADQSLSWAITLPDDTVVGTISLSLTPAHRRASAGYWLGVAYWNHGYMSEALRAVIAWAFDDLGYARVEARCLARNPASGRVMAKAGMVYEGRLRSWFLHHGVREDLLLYAIVNGDSTM